MSIYTRSFWAASFERAVKTAAQVAALFFIAGQTNAFAVAWAEVGGFALAGAVLSLLTSIGSDALTSTDGPSAINAERLD